jgi:hypothetical protein
MAQPRSETKVCPQSTDNFTGNNNAPRFLIPIEAEGFHAFADAYALDGQWVIFLSIAGHKDAVKAIRATLLTNHWINVGSHEICLLPRTKYSTSVKALPSGIVHTAIFIKNDVGQLQTHYALTAKPEPTDSDLYFTALIKHSAVPVHSNWKAWLHKRAVQRKEVETLTTHGIRGIKISLDDTSLAEDISTALKKGKLKKIFDNVSLLPFSKTSSRI